MTGDPPNDPTRETDDVAGAARAVEDIEPIEPDPLDDLDTRSDPDATAEPPAAISELAAACVRYVASRYKAALDFTPDTMSLLDQWLRDARPEARGRPEAAELVQSSAGAYLGEVVRRQFGARWISDGDPAGWRLCLSTVYCAFNPVGVAREALMLEPAEGWHAHLELDPGERDAVEARLEALPAADDEEYYAPSTRFDVLWIVVEALRGAMQARGLDDVRFTPEDYG
jgi:Family of unknown function (DUF6278)